MHVGIVAADVLLRGPVGHCPKLQGWVLLLGPLELGQNGELLGCPLRDIWVEDVLDQTLHFGGHSPTGGHPSAGAFLKLAHRPQWETLLPTHRYLYIGT